MLKRFMAIAVLFLISSCGFAPLHSVDSDSEFSKIKVVVADETKAPSKMTSLLKSELDDSLNVTGVNKLSEYLLDVRLVRVNTAYETQSNTVNLRTRVTITANFTLTTMSDFKVVLQDKVTSVDSFEDSDSPYATLISDEETANKMAQGLAKEIKLRVASKLKSL